MVVVIFSTYFPVNSDWAVFPAAGRRGRPQSQPVSPSRADTPLQWFVREIDIGDSRETRSERGADRRAQKTVYRAPMVRTRSRHDCSFVPGTPFLAGNRPLLLHPIALFCFTILLSRFLVNPRMRFTVVGATFCRVSVCATMWRPKLASNTINDGQKY